MGGVVYCPRCNVAVIVDEDVTLKLGHCANCFFAFCTECYEPWHHGLPCGEETESDSEEENRERKPTEELESHLKAADRTRSCHRSYVKRDKAEFHYLYECRHFFCTPCLKRYCQWYIDSGFLKNLKCPSRNCKASISIEILREVLDEERFKRHEKIYLAMSLGVSDMDLCPRCTMVVVPDENEDSAHGQCENCLYEFCTECYESWHPGKPCLGEAESHSVVNEKLKSDKAKGHGEEEGNSAVAVSSGKQRVQKAHKMSNLSFIRLMKEQGAYQSCPKCRMAVERISGCDMMHCSQCSASFCWTCGKAISGHGHFAYCGREDEDPRQTPAEGNVVKQEQETNPRRKIRTKPCPRCHQRCPKENSNNNHLKCQSCKTPFCYQCGKETKGTVTMHFTAASSCVQHSDD